MCIRDRADADSLIEAAETIKQDLQQQAEGTLIKEIFSKATTSNTPLPVRGAATIHR